MIFFQDGTSVHRVQNLLEVRLDVLDDHENLFEVSSINVFVIVKLLLYYLLARHRWNPSIGWISGPHVHLGHVVPWGDNVIKLGGEHIVFHESKFAQDLDLAQNLSGRILVVKCIADLLDGDFFLRCSVLGFDHPAETALAAYF